MVCCWVHLLWHFRLVLVSEPKSFYLILRKVWCDLGSLVDGILSSQTSLWYYFSRCCSVFLRSLEFGLPRNCFRCIRMLLFMLVWKTHTHIYSLHLGCGLKPNQPPRNHGRHASIPDFRSRSLRESFHPLYYTVVLEHVIYIPDPVLRCFEGLHLKTCGVPPGSWGDVLPAFEGYEMPTVRGQRWLCDKLSWSCDTWGRRCLLWKLWGEELSTVPCECGNLEA